MLKTWAVCLDKQKRFIPNEYMSHAKNFKIKTTSFVYQPNFWVRILQLGFSKPWPEALEAMTGRNDMSAESFIKYFLPLFDFLVEENKGECIGWSGKWQMAMTR